MRVLRELLFSLYGNTWIISDSMREILLGWNWQEKNESLASGSFLLVLDIMEGKEKNCLQARFFVYTKTRILVSFNDLFETKLSIENSPSNFVGFID